MRSRLAASLSLVPRLPPVSMHLRFSIKFVLVPSVRMDYIASTLFILFIFILLSIKHQFLIVCITIRQNLCPCVHFQFASFLSTSRCLLCSALSFRLLFLYRCGLFVYSRHRSHSIFHIVPKEKKTVWNERNSSQNKNNQRVDRFLLLFILAICWWNMVHVKRIRDDAREQQDQIKCRF